MLRSNDTYHPFESMVIAMIGVWIASRCTTGWRGSSRIDDAVGAWPCHGLPPVSRER